MIPAGLRQYAKLVKEVVVIGVSTRVELWSKEVGTEYAQEAEASFEAIAEKIVDLGHLGGTMCVEFDHKPVLLSGDPVFAAQGGRDLPRCAP